MHNETYARTLQNINKAFEFCIVSENYAILDISPAYCSD